MQVRYGARLAKIEQYMGEPIKNEAEQVDGDDAAVLSRVVTPKGAEIGIEYRLYRVPDRWAVYDVKVDGVSIGNSDKAQFTRLLQRGSFAELLMSGPQLSRIDEESRHGDE